jgi:hypothetical protein
MSDRDTSRRRFLTIAGSSVAVSLAGCSSGDAGDGGSGNSEPMDDDSMDGDSMGNESMDDTESMEGDSMDDGESIEDGSMDDGPSPTNPEDAPRAAIDRFSEEAGTLLVRSADNDLPEPNEPIDFDQKPFFHQGLGPDGEVIQYYNFDVQPTEPAPIYALFRENGDPVEGQLNIVDVVPGDDGYNDFWQVHRVTVPDSYEANAATSVADLTDAGYDIEATGTIKNCPVVPDGSTAEKRNGDADPGLIDGWYDGEVVSYFLFEEAPLETSNGSVPRSPIYVTFNTNPGRDGGGPPSGFVTEADSVQNHNVVASLPGEESYSPLWLVTIYDNADFAEVSDLDSAMDADVLASGAANVNCPIVSVE